MRRVDYITSDSWNGIFPTDYYYSYDSNPNDAVAVQEHRLDFESPPPSHVPPTAKINKKIANLIVSLIIQGSR